MSGSDWVVALGAFAASASTSALLVWRVRCWAEHRLLDVPNARSSHVHPTPRGGGVGIVVTVALGLAATAGALDESQWLVLAVAGGLVAALSFADDLRPLPAVVRLVCHVAIVAGTLVALGASGHALPPSFRGWVGAATMLGLVVWVVGLMNAYNFMDGIDGIAATQALVAGLGWLLLGSWAANRGLSVAGLLVAGAALGFLWFNWPPARIFMGDVGSVFLGFLFAMLALMAGWRDPWTGVAGALLVWPFVFDASVTFLRRAARGEKLLRAHRSHLYQRLVGAGWTHRRTTLLYGAMAGVGVIAGGLCLPGTVFGRMLSAIVATGGAAVLWLVTATVESRVPARVPVTGATNTPTSA